MLMDKFTRFDLGLKVVNRAGEEGVVSGHLINFSTGDVPFCNYTPDLYYYDGGDTEHPLDIMQVKLASGTLLWARANVIVRRFSANMALYNREDKVLPERYKGLHAKLVSFVLPAGTTEDMLTPETLGSCGGIDIEYRDTIPLVPIFVDRG